MSWKRDIERMIIPIFYRFFQPLIRSKRLAGTVCLCYHEARAVRFRNHVRFLKRYYQIISIETVVRRIQENKPLPDNSVVITFDDGYRTLYEEVFPVVKQEEIPVSIFLITDLIDSDQPDWVQKADIIRQQKPEFPSISNLMAQPYEDRVQKIQSNWKKSYPKLKRFYLNREELLEMNEFSYVSFQSHGMSHSNMRQQSEKLVYREMKESKDRIESLLGNRVDLFAYPFGLYRKSHKPLLKKAGYRGALTTDPGVNTERTNPFFIRRISATGEYPGNNLIRHCAPPISLLDTRMHGILRHLVPVGSSYQLSDSMDGGSTNGNP